MPDLIPFVVGTVATDLVLLGVFAELYRRERGHHLALWAAAYALDACRHALSVTDIALGGAPIARALGTAFLIAGAMALLAGTASFAGRRLSRAWPVVGVVAGAWGMAALPMGAPHALATLPPALVLGAARILSGAELLRAKDISPWPRALGGVPLIVHGLHAANYPFLRPIAWIAPWGFLASALLTTMVAIGILLIHSERARVAAQASARQYQELFDGSMEGIFRTSTQGRFVAANPALVKMLGYDTEEELRALDLLRDVYANPADRARILAHADGDVDTVQVKRKDGSIIDVAVHGNRRYDEKGVVLWFEGSMRDVTAEKRLERELADAQRMEALGRMAGGIAHDFNNVLATIVAATELAQVRAARGQPIDGELEDVKNAAMRAGELTRHLLAFGKKQVLARQPLDLGRAVRESTRVLSRVLGEDVALAVEIPDEELVVLANGGQIEQIVLNLALNARDAMPRGGRLRIALARAEHDQAPHARLVVQDDGEGMDEETRARMFEPFFSTKPRGAGTGLGLSSVYGIVSQAGGRIDVESAPGKGTTISVLWPIAAGATLAPAAREEAPRPIASPLRVLLVEDDPSLRALTERALRDRGHDVLAAPSAESALASFEAAPQAFDVVISDVVMAGASGTDLARDLRARCRDVGIVLVSGHAAEKSGEIARLGVEFLAKPYTHDQLHDAVARGRRHAARG